MSVNPIQEKTVISPLSFAISTNIDTYKLKKALITKRKVR